MLEIITKEILNGRRLTRQDNLYFLITADLEKLLECADKIRVTMCGNKVNLCTIINGKSGKCSENCKFCAQSAHHRTGMKEYSFLDTDTIVKDCLENEKEGVHRYSIVTAGRSLQGEDFKKALNAYEKMHEDCNLDLCASHGLLEEEEFVALKKSGVSRYHANIETSKRNFPNICSTHTYEDKIRCIKLARKASLSVCSGVIIGMGEDFYDIIDMAVSLSELKVDSIPINALMPIKGTPLESEKEVTEEYILRAIAMFRFLNPSAEIRLAAGRALIKDSGKKAFLAGANATITGNMLTTVGSNTKKDIKMLTEMGFDLSQ